MIYMVITRSNGITTVEVFPNPKRKYMGYDTKEAIKNYREEFKLKNKQMIVVEV